MDIFDKILDNLGTFVSITGFSLAAIVTFSIRRIKQRVQVRPICKSTDKDFDDFSDLFEKRIRFELRESPEDIGEWLDEFEHDKKEGRISLQEYLLVAKYKQKVFGFLFFEYSMKSNFVYIDFLGAKGNERDKLYKKATRLLVRKCYQILNKKMKNCKLIVFELDDENDKKLNEEQRQKAKVKKRLFASQVALNKEIKKRNAKVYEVCIEYYQPHLHNSNPKGVKQSLMIIPLNWNVISSDMTFSKIHLQEILDFLFFESYDPLSKENFLGTEYHAALIAYYRKILDSASERIKLKQHTKD